MSPDLGVLTIDTLVSRSNQCNGPLRDLLSNLRLQGIERCYTWCMDIVPLPDGWSGLGIISQDVSQWAEVYVCPDGDHVVLLLSDPDTHETTARLDLTGLAPVVLAALLDLGYTMIAAKQVDPELLDGLAGIRSSLDNLFSTLQGAPSDTPEA